MKPEKLSGGPSIDPSIIAKLDRAQLKLIQADLKSRNLYTGKIDGVYGPLTEAAINRYNQNGVYQPTITDSAPNMRSAVGHGELQTQLDKTGTN